MGIKVDVTLGYDVVGERVVRMGKMGVFANQVAIGGVLWLGASFLPLSLTLFEMFMLTKRFLNALHSWSDLLHYYFYFSCTLLGSLFLVYSSVASISY